jgi:RNA polymerase-binding transcription factor DksA
MNHTIRTSNLKHMLSARRHEASSYTRADVDEPGTGLALMAARAQAVDRLDNALAQLDSGNYGSCIECAREISESRLNVSPFTLRCQACDDDRQPDVSGHNAA